MTAGRVREQHADHDASLRRRQRADQSRGPDEVRLLRRRAPEPEHEHHEDADEDDRVDERERALQRQGQRVERRQREERDLDRVRAFERDVGVELAGVPVLAGDARHPPRREQHDHRPADADQQPVAAGHVGERERRVLLGVLAGLVGEREVDGVLGQHRDEGQHGEGEALRHVELERLGRPGEQERRAEDGEAEDDRCHDVAEAGAREPGEHSGEGQRRWRPRGPAPGPGARGGLWACSPGPSASPAPSYGSGFPAPARRAARSSTIRKTPNELSGTWEEQPK